MSKLFMYGTSLEGIEQLALECIQSLLSWAEFLDSSGMSVIHLKLERTYYALTKKMREDTDYNKDSLKPTAIDTIIYGM